MPVGWAIKRLNLLTKVIIAFTVFIFTWLRVYAILMRHERPLLGQLGHMASAIRTHDHCPDWGPGIPLRDSHREGLKR